MPIPDFQTLMLPTLRRLVERRWRTAELIAALSDEFGLTDAERTALLPSGRQPVIANRTHWSLAYLNKSGLITRVGRGEYEASDAGRGVVAAPPPRITLAWLTQHFEGARAFRGEGNGPAETSGSTSTAPTILHTPRERIEAAAIELQDALAAELLDRLRGIAPAAFERVIVDLLVRMGFGGSRQDAGERLGGTGDGGVDGIIRQDALGLDAVYVQAKRYAEDNPVGAPAVQGFAGALLARGATKGVFVTTSRFTAAAREAVDHYRSHRIVLIDGAELARLMIRHEVGVRTTQIIRIGRVDLEGYEDDG